MSSQVQRFFMRKTKADADFNLGCMHMPTLPYAGNLFVVLFDKSRAFTSYNPTSVPSEKECKLVIYEVESKVKDTMCIKRIGEKHPLYIHKDTHSCTPPLPPNKIHTYCTVHGK